MRLTHLPTGIVVFCQTERSQFQNRDNAMKMLRARLAELKLQQHAEKISDLKGVQMKIEWGSQIRSYVFMPYTLAKDTTGRTIYILDEPTTGLHTDDVKKLLEVLQRLVDEGNTVLVIEHNLDVIKSADYLIDLGPEGGSGGGTVVATGTPETVARCESSYTGQYLKPLLD